MPENMSISVNGQSQVPPGFRFHPTEEELLQYYLKKKVSNLSIDLDVIRDVDLNKLEPWDIQEKCKIGTTPQNDWYFFSHKDKKYPTGTRTNRATAAGFWKATGRDKVIFSNCRRIGMRKTLVFYKGRAPHGQKSDWIMHEYRLDDNTNDTNVSAVVSEAGQEEGWVVCRIFKKKNHHKTLDSPVNSSITAEAMRNNQMMMFDSCNEGALEQIFQYMGRSRTCKEENLNNGGYPFERFSKLPSLESPNSDMITDKEDSTMVTNQVDHNYGGYQMDSSLMITNWVTLDRLVASQLNGQSSDPTMDAYCTNQDHDAAQILSSVVRSSSSSSNKSYRATQDHYTNEMELWSFARSSSSLSSSDPLCHVSDAPL